jgi:hypothetical protein
MIHINPEAASRGMAAVSATDERTAALSLDRSPAASQPTKLPSAAPTLFLAINPHDRAVISTTIERLINMLDALDGDVDLEPDNDGEPWLGWPEAFPGSGAGRRLRADNDDREIEDEHDEDGGDTEPNGDEQDYDGGENDMPGFIRGGQGA